MAMMLQKMDLFMLDKFTQIKEEGDILRNLVDTKIENLEMRLLKKLYEY